MSDGMTTIVELIVGKIEAGQKWVENNTKLLDKIRNLSVIQLKTDIIWKLN